jgi:hypothetical protein
MRLAPGRGVGLWLLLVLSWGLGRLAVGRSMSGKWDLAPRAAVETLAVASLQWLAVGGWRPRRSPS